MLVLTGEDDPGKVLKARYIAAGADVSKVFVLSSDEYFDRAGKILTIKDAALAEYAAKYDPETECFRRGLAQLDRALAKMADTVIEVSAGNLIFHKGALPQ